MDKKIQKELRDSSRIFNGCWARLLKFGPEDKVEEFKEAARNLQVALEKVIDGTDKSETGA